MREEYVEGASEPLRQAREEARDDYARRVKKRVTIRLDRATIEYFKGLSEETGIPYQTLINLYPGDCAASGRRLSMGWRPKNKGRIGRPTVRRSDHTPRVH